MTAQTSSTRTTLKSLLSTVLLQYFRILAQIQLAKIRPTIVGITGSAGKTSTLHAIHAVLKPHFSTKASYKANSESGLPLNILGLSAERFTVTEWLKLALLAPLQLLTNWKKYDCYIAEMGIDGPHAPKNMAYLLTLFQPKVGVLLNARPMHSQGFDELVAPSDESERKTLVSRAIANEKGRMIVGLPKDGLAVLNSDDTHVAAFAKKTQARVCAFGKNSDSQVRLVQAEQSVQGTRFTFATHWKDATYPEDASAKLANTPTQRSSSGTTSICFFPRYVLPEHFGYSLAAAVCVGHYFGITPEQSCRNLEQHYQLPPGRASLLEGINNSHIIDSSYNSSAQAAVDMLDLLHTIAPSRKLALLGDIRELGSVAQEEHELVADRAAKICDEVILVGPQMKQYALPVISKTKTPARWYASAQEAAVYLHNTLQPQDTLLVKGSQNTLLLEIAVEQLLANPEEAAQLLCRRGAFWDKERGKLVINTNRNEK